MSLVAGVTPDGPRASRPVNWSAMSPPRSAARAVGVPIWPRPVAPTPPASPWRWRWPEWVLARVTSSVPVFFPLPSPASGRVGYRCHWQRKQSMALIVQKYGGTSVGSIERIENVAEQVKRWRDRGHQSSSSCPP